MSKTNRTKGHNAERYYASVFKELFPDCQTARYASRQMDDAKVDLVGLPFLVQIKAGQQRGMKRGEILESMYNLVPQAYKDQMKILIHHKQGTKGKKRTQFDTLVTMTFDDFYSLIKQVHNNDNQTK